MNPDDRVLVDGVARATVRIVVRDGLVCVRMDEDGHSYWITPGRLAPDTPTTEETA